MTECQTAILIQNDYMAKSKVIAGVDLGSSKISTIVSQISVDSVSLATEVNIVGVSSVESRGIKKGQIVDIEEAVEATIESVEAAERMAGYNLEKAFISLGGAHVASQNSHGVVAVSEPDGEIVEADIDRRMQS